MNTPSPASLPVEAVKRQRATFTSQLLLAEHEVATLEGRLADKRSEVEQLRGAVQACDTLLRLPPEPVAEKAAPAKPQDKTTA